MTDECHKNHSPAEAHEPHRHRFAWGWWVFAAIGLFYLITEHQTHFFGALPYLLLLACPLMHLFMHHGHGHKSKTPTDKKEDKTYLAEM